LRVTKPVDGIPTKDNTGLESTLQFIYKNPSKPYLKERRMTLKASKKMEPRGGFLT